MFTNFDFCVLIGGRPYPSVAAHNIPYKIKGGYRMPKPGHLDDDMCVQHYCGLDTFTCGSSDTRDILLQSRSK